MFDNWWSTVKEISGGIGNKYRRPRCDDEGRAEVVVSGLTLEGFSYGAAPVQKIPVAASASSVTLLAANASRKLGSVFTNKSVSATLYISKSATATTAAPIILSPGSTYVMDDSNYLGIITGIWDAAVGQCNVEEAV